MIWWHFKNVLEEECIQFSNLLIFFGTFYYKFDLRNKYSIENTCQNITSWHTAAKRIAVDFGSSHRIDVKLSGVNCNTTRLILPVVDEISLMLAHLYSRISSALQILKPTQMPRPLQMRTSKMSASHQHSMKFGSKCAKVISVISHITDMAHKMPACRMSTALKAQPRK